MVVGCPRVAAIIAPRLCRQAACPAGPRPPPPWRRVRHPAPLALPAKAARAAGAAQL